jgi:hypothetical protein
LWRRTEKANRGKLLFAVPISLHASSWDPPHPIAHTLIAVWKEVIGKAEARCPLIQFPPSIQLPTAEEKENGP